MKWSDVIQASRVKYLNMISQDDWEKVDHRNAKLIALSTQLDQPKAKCPIDKPTDSGGAQGAGGSGGDMISGVFALFM